MRYSKNESPIAPKEILGVVHMPLSGDRNSGNSPSPPAGVRLFLASSGLVMNCEE
jgi:hypothetical protein